MSRLVYLTSLLVALTSAPASADRLVLTPNSVGDNFAYITPTLSLFGGTDALFFGNIGYPPGTAVGGIGGLFLNSTVVNVDGTPLEFFFNPGTISMTSLTLPANGKDVIVPENISFSATGFNFDTGQTLNVGGGAQGRIAYSFSNGLYHPGEFVQGPLPTVTPEPGTLTLIGTGLLGLVSIGRKRVESLRRGDSL
jgi:hypothetical protein